MIKHIYPNIEQIPLTKRSKITNEKLIAIAKEVSSITGVSIAQMQSKRRTDKIVYARYLFTKKSREIDKMTWKRVAKAINRDHSTAIHYLTKYTPPEYLT